MNIMLNKNKFLPLHREKWLYMYAWWIITLDTLNRNGQWTNTRSRWSLATTRSVYVKFKQKCLIK
jgi:hypothetical protein